MMKRMTMVAMIAVLTLTGAAEAAPKRAKPAPAPVVVVQEAKPEWAGATIFRFFRASAECVKETRGTKALDLTTASVRIPAY